MSPVPSVASKHQSAKARKSAAKKKWGKNGWNRAPGRGHRNTGSTALKCWSNVQWIVVEHCRNFIMYFGFCAHITAIIQTNCINVISYYSDIFCVLLPVRLNAAKSKRASASFSSLKLKHLHRCLARLAHLEEWFFRIKLRWKKIELGSSSYLLEFQRIIT